MPKPKPDPNEIVLINGAVTRAERATIQHLSVDEDLNQKELVGELIREGLKLKTETEKGGGK